MKIAFAASEAAPYIKTGGLGDVAQALPAALSQNSDNEVLLFLPYYGKIKDNPSITAEYIGYYYTDLSWRHQYVGLYKAQGTQPNLHVYLIDNEQYFKRDGGIYGHADDGERFAFFAKAILDALVYLGVQPDVIHCNDWQTALLPIFLHAFYQQELGAAKTVFTIHNIEYQGWAQPYFLGDVLGLSSEHENTLTYKGAINFMKGAILTCDALTTVSRTYAQEIRYPYFAHGLSPIIDEHAFKVLGIVNGIDTQGNNPALDPALSVNYTAADMSGKKICKQALQEQLGLPVRDDVAVIGMVTRLVSHKGLDILCAVAEELMGWDIQLVILGTGDAIYEDRLRAIADQHPDKFSLNLCFSGNLASQIYAGSDLYLMPSKSEPCGLSQLIAMRYGSIPVVHETGGLKDTVLPFNPQSEEGYGFTFQSFNGQDMLDALRRALSVYGGDKSAWSRVIKNGMTADLSWRKPAAEYMALYTDLINNA
jgi:starch synthase